MAVIGGTRPKRGLAGIDNVADITRVDKAANMAALKVLLTLVAAAVLWTGMLSYVERERTIEGIWTDAFECSEFFENARFEDLANQQCGEGAWLYYYRPEKSSEHYDLVMRHSKNPETRKFRTWPPAKYFIRFRGERDVSLFGLGVVLPVGFGHFSSWGTEYRVQRMILIKPLPIRGNGS